MFNQPAGFYGNFTNKDTGNGRNDDHHGNLFLWGTNLGISLDGRELFCMKDVSINGGDGFVEENVLSYDQAFAKVKTYTKTTESAFLWDLKSKRLIEKPASAKSGVWAKGLGTCLYMFADEIVIQERLD